jgi:DNA-binding LacI/PurR family transcriptional regulator
MADRPATITDVAARAGVSISTVSSALNGRPGVSEATRERIRALAEELGFVPSLRGRSLSAKRSFNVGLIIQRSSDVVESDPFFASFIGGAESVLSAHGYGLVLQMADSADKALRYYRQMAADRRVDGVFLNELEVDDPRVELVRELNLPAVAINADPGEFPVPVVRQGFRPGIVALVAYLAGMGHTSIAHLAGPTRFLHSRQREEAWRSALEDMGLAPGPVVVGDFTFEGGAGAAEAVLTMAERPTAVVCANDLMAAGFLTRAQDLGLRIPRDMSVAGYDGVPLGHYIRPRLTTLKTSPHELAAQASRMLLAVVDGEQVDDVEIAPATLKLRESTGSVPAAYRQAAVGQRANRRRPAYRQGIA